VSRYSGIVKLLEPSGPVQACYRDSFTITMNLEGRRSATTQYNQFCGEERTRFFLRGAGPRHGENAAKSA